MAPPAHRALMLRPERHEAYETGSNGGELGPSGFAVQVGSPEALRLAVPGMPFGSPSIGSETERNASGVMLFRADNSTEASASHFGP